MFPSKENFREKMRKFISYFREISWKRLKFRIFLQFCFVSKSFFRTKKCCTFFCYWNAKKCEVIGEKIFSHFAWVETLLITKPLKIWDKSAKCRQTAEPSAQNAYCLLLYFKAFLLYKKTFRYAESNYRISLNSA